ncbi:hypothetical protein [Chryseobacterium sp. W4I1]|uniref:hypothetical protein n=1 Tax=Chryseobacterium sp. W4I1 TaxID=3042293 RepID=UPI002788E35C|nr:hypothetical protein [Chryseobacterium sp. W4I1]MDQ0780573.1 hypothetical protein [Chryseobacterium sp. W4I1]
MNINNVFGMFTQSYLKFLSWLFPIDEQERDILPVSSYHYYSPSPFQMLIIDYLAWNGVDKKGNVNRKKAYPTSIEIQENQTALGKCGFANGEYIEKLIVSEFLEMKVNIPDLNPVMFANFYEDIYHNVRLVRFASLEAQKSNKNTKQYFNTIKEFLIQIQGFLEGEDLRVRIESNFTETGHWGNCSRVEEFVTPFTRIQLNCNTLGQFSINYFINPHLKELLGGFLGNTVEKWFDELINGEMKDLVKMVSLNRRYDRYFEELVKFTKIYPNYKAVTTERSSL